MIQLMLMALLIMRASADKNKRLSRYYPEGQRLTVLLSRVWPGARPLALVVFVVVVAAAVYVAIFAVAVAVVVVVVAVFCCCCFFVCCFCCCCCCLLFVFFFLAERYRWENGMDPTLNRNDWGPEEDAAVLRLVARLGSHWTKIAETFPGRTDDQVRRRYLKLQNRLSGGTEEL